MCGREFLLDNKALSRPDCKARHRASPAIQAIGLTRLPACAAVGSQERARPTACGCGCGCCLQLPVCSEGRPRSSRTYQARGIAKVRFGFLLLAMPWPASAIIHSSLAAWGLGLPCSRYGQPPQRDVATPELMWRTAVNTLPIPPVRPAL